VAAHLEPEILLVDEVLAVGDAAFQKKCLGKMEGVAREGRTVLFVSHNMAAIENLCSRAILLDSGNLIRQGGVPQVISYYLQSVLPSAIERVPLADRKDRSGNGRIRLTSFHIEDAQGNRLTTARSGMEVALVFGFECSDDDAPRNVDVGFSIHASNGQTLLVLYSSYLGETFDGVPRTGAFRCLVPKLPLSAGQYRVGARVTVGGEEADWPRNGVGDFDVVPGDFYGTGSEGFGRATPFLLSGRWHLRET
jgi:lipopolysaccharide transport system ATP-binding protein